MSVLGSNASLTTPYNMAEEDGYDQVSYANTSRVMRQMLEDPLQPIMLENRLVCCVVTVVIFLSAVIALLVTVRSPALPVNRYFLMSLCIADLLQALTALLSITVAVSTDWDILPPIVWLFQVFFSLNSWIAGMYSLASINIDHYMAVNDPVHYLQHVGPRKSTNWVIFIWILGFAYTFPLFILGPKSVVLCSSTLLFCTINHHRIIAYCVTAALILLPPPLLIFLVTGSRGLVPRADDMSRASSHQLAMFKANTLAGLVTLVLWVVAVSGLFATDSPSTYRLISFWCGISAPLWKLLVYWIVSSGTIRQLYAAHKHEMMYT